MDNDGFIPIPIPVDLYCKLDQWRIALCRKYHINDMKMDAFIALLLFRSEVDCSILEWDLTEGLDAFKDFKKYYDN